MSALNESILSLRRNLGLSEERALELLSTKISVRKTGNSQLRVFEEFLLLMLKKTFLNVEELPSGKNTPYTEVTIQHKDPLSVFISFTETEARVGLIKPELNKCITHSDPFQLLTAAYATGAVVVHSTEERIIKRGEKYPIILNWENLFGKDLSFIEQETEIGEHHLAGAGATGSWLLKTMEYMNLKGNLSVYDDDFVSAGNLQRTTFEKEDVNTPKVEAINKRFNPINKGLTFCPVQKRYAASDALYENVITCVDSRIARRTIQDSMPMRTFDCSTTDISEVSLFFGGLSADQACLGCLYSENQSEEGMIEDIAGALGIPTSEVKKGTIDGLNAILIHNKYPEIVPKEIIGLAYETLAKALCGKGALKPSDEVKLQDVNIAPLCHVSAVAGIFLAIEIKRRFHFKTTSNNWNYWKINPWTTPTSKLQKCYEVQDKCLFHPTACELALKIWDRSRPKSGTMMSNNKRNHLVDDYTS
jgi:molybdopterin/thiamine biosynthesis adenylyltransferase